MKKFLTLLFIITLTVILNPLTAKAEEYQISYVCSQDYKGSILHFLNWGEYIDEELIDVFEKKCNAKVILEIADSSETMRSRLTSGAEKYDLLTPSDYMIENLINNDWLAELNYSNLPNYYIEKDGNQVSVIESQLLGESHDPENKYSVPYFWGTVGIMYNKDKIEALGINEEELESWGILWDERLKNKIDMYESHRDLFMVAFKLLGYSINLEENETIDQYKAKIDEAKAKLIEQKPLVRSYGTDNIKRAVANGDTAVGVVYSGDFLDTFFQILEEEGEPNIGYVVPKEGSNLWIDGFVIPRNTDNKRLAEEFINFFLDPQVAYYNAAYVGYSTPNSLAYEILLEDEDYRELVILDAYKPSAEELENTEVYKDLGQELNEYLAEAFMSVKQDKLTWKQIIIISVVVVAVLGGVGYKFYLNKKRRVIK